VCEAPLESHALARGRFTPRHDSCATKESNRQLRIRVRFGARKFAVFPAGDESKRTACYKALRLPTPSRPRDLNSSFRASFIIEFTLPRLASYDLFGGGESVDTVPGTEE
jgi:hypothetical protein